MSIYSLKPSDAELVEALSHKLHDNCFLCHEVIDWIEDYGHSFPDGLASCVTCQNLNGSLWWYAEYLRKQAEVAQVEQTEEVQKSLWEKFDRFCEEYTDELKAISERFAQ